MSLPRPNARGADGAALTDAAKDYEAVAVLTALPKQARSAARIVRRFLWAQPIRSAADIDAAAVRQYLADVRRQGRSAKTLLNHRSVLSRFCAFLQERRLLRSNPCRYVQLGKLDEPLPRFLDEDETAEVLFASRAARRGVSLYKLAAWLGHSDVRMTRIYAHLQQGFDSDIERAAP